jgi:aldose 1-epimerase
MIVRSISLAAVVFLSAMTVQANTTSEPWGKTADGKTVELWTLRNANGMEAKVTTYGAILVSLTAPDRDGKMADVVTGKKDLAGYLAGHPGFGATIGRYANRIGNSQFTLDDKVIKVTPTGGGKHSLHGGKSGFDDQVWGAQLRPGNSPGVEFHYTSADGEEGYTGKLVCSVTYRLTDDNALELHYQATTDKPTVINLTNHAYFNLGGHDSGTVLDHVLTIHSSQYTATDADLIPTGEIADLAGTPLDFSKATVVGKRINDDHPAIKMGHGYDHNFILNEGKGLKPCALLTDPKSGRSMEVTTTEPAVQLYTGNHLKDVAGKDGAIYQRRDALCLETQHYPDSPNHPKFPSTVLRPGKTFTSVTRYKFSAQ